MNTLSYSPAGLKLTCDAEGLRLKAYQDSVGVWTIGYGHTGADVHPGLQITQAQADQLLQADLQKAVACVNSVVTAPLTQGQFDALVDFCFNMGPGRLRDSTLLRLLNRGDYDGAAGQFGLWVHGGGKVLPGLVKRRAAETVMFRGILANPVASPLPSQSSSR